MLRKFRQKVVASISEFSIPEQFSFKVGFRIPSNATQNFDIAAPIIATSRFNIPNSAVSNNNCFEITEALLETSVLIKKDQSGIYFICRHYERGERIEPLPFPKTLQGLKVLHSTVFECPLLIFSPIYEIGTILDSQVKTFRIKEKSIFYYPDIIDLTDDLFLGIEISANLFEPLGKRNPEGANYRSTLDEQKELFPVNQNNKSEAIAGHRKAYTLEKSGRSTTIKRKSIWDLLYPLLLPPLTLDYAEHFDFYKPLFGYQQEGIEFFVGNTSALLADEMGTGKTVQTIIALRILFRQGKIKSALVLSPVAALGSAELSLKTGQSEGWDGHFHHWAPELSVTVVRGNQEQRYMDWDCSAHVYITTLDSLRNDIEIKILKEDKFHKFECIIVDEAQNIKNIKSGRAKAIKKLKPRYRWALTGTPIENKVEDVISIFDFIKPGHFKRDYYAPQEVKSSIAPYFLRRLKKDVMKDLPEKIRQEEWLELAAEQQSEYNKVLDGGRIELADTVKTKSEFQVRAHIFRLLQKLKQICNFASTQYTSPKTELLLDHLRIIIENGEKVLIFSQYKEYGIDRLERVLEENYINFVTYEGGMSDRQRQEVVHNFRSNPEISVFLGAVRASGVAMTLTEASYVIHFDHWWNPAVMWQAEDRAHRHGQKKCLNVYSYWMKDTIEERIKEKLHQKGLLIESVIDSLAVESIEEMISTNEWLQMLGVEKATPSKDAPDRSPESVREQLRKFSPSDFEEKSRDFLVKLGYLNAKVTQRSRDGGIDVFGSRKINDEEETIVAQCKRTDTVGVNVARELLGVLTANEKISKGFIITTGVFTDDCKRFAATNPKLNLIDGLTLSNYLFQFKLL